MHAEIKVNNIALAKTALIAVFPNINFTMGRNRAAEQAPGLFPDSIDVQELLNALGIGTDQTDAGDVVIDWVDIEPTKVGLLRFVSVINAVRPYLV